MRYTAKILIIIGDKMHTKLLQTCDMFEPDKVLGFIKEFEIAFDATEFKIENGQPFVDAFTKTYTDDKNFILSFVHLISVKNKDVIMLNNDKVIPYINKKVRQISDGKSFFLFSKYLKNMGIKVKTDEYFFIQ